MGAPLGNQYWRERADLSKDGKKLSIEEVKTKLTEYIERCVNDKLTEPDWVGKDAKEVTRPHMIAMSIYGACAYLAIDDQTWLNWKKDEKYFGILTRAEMIFKAYNIEGSSAGMLNQAIIARLEGLTDKQDITSKGKELKSLTLKIGDKEFDV